MRKNSIRLVTLTGLLAFLLSGCAMIPKYSRPASPVPSAWPESAVVKTEAAAAPEGTALSWQEFFNDQKLRSVIDLTLKNNRDLKIVALNVEKVRQAYRIQRASIYPSVGASGRVDNYRIPEKASSTGTAYEVDQYSVLGNVSWEIDLFGRLHSLKTRALNQFFATEQARTATQISLVAGVAEAYLLLAADRESLALAQATLASQEAYFQLVLKSREAGVASDLTVSQSKSQVEMAKVEVAIYTGLVAVDQNTLNLLAGTTIPDELLPVGLDDVGELKDVSAGLSSDILLRRPDIMSAEYSLKAANANIGAARANFFPRISLTAAAGTLAPELSQLFGGGTGFWEYTPSVYQPIFNGGALKANLKMAKTDREIAVAQYEKAIQTAFKEVSDALAKRSALVNQLEAQESLVQSLDMSYRLSDARFKEGIDSYLGVLISQQSLYNAQRALVTTRLAKRANQVELFKVLGGGI